ncbi:MAG: RING finger protein [Eubacteriales bacterium]|nr:RING finger protein [Eubacteriales bacterium]
MSEYAGKICPFCKTEIKPEDEVKVCPTCETPHHPGCWQENRGCTTFGCSEQHYEPQGTNISDVCSACEMPLGDGQEFCPKCGTSKGEPPANVCGKCGEQLQDGQEFCPKCGQKAGLALDSAVADRINKANAGVTKKKVVVPIVAAVVVVIVTLIGVFVNNQMQAKKLAEATDAYIADAKSFSTQVLSSAIKLETVGNKMETYWYNHIWENGFFKDGGEYVFTRDITHAVSQAQTKTATELSYAKSHDSDIQKLYNSLKKVPDEKNEDLQELKDAVKALYDEYTEFYNCIVDPTGNYSSWTSDFGNLDSSLLKAYKSLSSLLDDFD